MARPGNERNPLIEAAQLNAKPAAVCTTHVGANRAGGDFAPIRVRPCNSTSADVRAVLDKSLSREPVRSSFSPSCRQTRSRGRGI